MAFEIKRSAGKWQLKDRPDPMGRVATNWGENRGWTKHHLIPWNRLQAMASYVFNCPDGKKRRALWLTIIGMACPNILPRHSDEAYGALGKAPEFGPVGAGLREDYVGQHRLGDGYSNERTAEARGLVSVVHDLCWMPGNLFLGKASENRADDPGDEGFDYPPFELYDRPGNRERVKVLHKLYVYLRREQSYWDYTTLLDALDPVKSAAPYDGERRMITVEGPGGHWENSVERPGRFVLATSQRTKIALGA